MSKPPPWRAPSEHADNPDTGEAQRVFDTVVAPNLRISDNLAQLAVIVVGGAVGAIIGAVWAAVTKNPPLAGGILGGLAGVVISLFLSGAIIGVVRLISAAKRR